MIIVPYICKDEMKGNSCDNAGIDLIAQEDALVRFGRPCIINTGLRIQIPSNSVGLIKGRSGLAFNHNVFCFDGVIDSSYRGEVKVKLFTHSADVGYFIKKGDRVAQLLILPYETAYLFKTDELNNTNRGEKGFGSSGR